jgi:hypothetical protein
MIGTSCPLAEMMVELAKIAPDHWMHAAVAAELAKGKPVQSVIASAPCHQNH